MSTKIEKLLRIVGDMKLLEEDNASKSEYKVIDLVFGELSEDDLDLVSAATKEPSDKSHDKTRF